mmetsp:Transcript_26549/g.44374  ORF Transcript_26549/g.44374 Transcript_26549/m.44374 type:complete len:324 (-) Transcript_26549:43-1014(-)
MMTAMMTIQYNSHSWQFLQTIIIGWDWKKRSHRSLFRLKRTMKWTFRLTSQSSPSWLSPQVIAARSADRMMKFTVMTGHRNCPIPMMKSTVMTRHLPLHTERPSMSLCFTWTAAMKRKKDRRLPTFALQYRPLRLQTIPLLKKMQVIQRRNRPIEKTLWTNSARPATVLPMHHLPIHQTRKSAGGLTLILKPTKRRHNRMALSNALILPRRMQCLPSHWTMTGHPGPLLLKDPLIVQPIGNTKRAVVERQMMMPQLRAMVNFHRNEEKSMTVQMTLRQKNKAFRFDQMTVKVQVKHCRRSTMRCRLRALRDSGLWRLFHLTWI